MTNNFIKQSWAEKAKKNLTDFFEGSRKIVFKFELCDPGVFEGLTNLAETKKDKGKIILDHELDLNNQLQGLQNRFQMEMEDDFVYALHPYTGIGVFASAFGCKTDFPQDSDPITYPVINSILQVDNLKTDIKNSDLIKLTFEKIDHFINATNGAFPVCYPDLQSPIDVASIVCDYSELLLAMLTEPERVHKLLTIITDTMEDVLEKLDKRLSPFPPSANWWMPKGIWMSDDLMAVLGPELYEEFAMPYVNRLGKKYGGLFLHSCGNPLPCVETLKKYENFLGLDFWEVTIKQFQEAGGDFACSSPVVEDPWHNLNRREGRTSPSQTIDDAMADLLKLTKYTDRSIIFYAACPNSNYAQKYYSTLVQITDEINNV